MFTYILFDGLTYNRSNEHNVREYYMLKPSNKRLIIPLQKRCYFASILCGKSVLKAMHHLSFRARASDVNSTKRQPKIFISLDKQNDE